MHAFTRVLLVAAAAILAGVSLFPESGGAQSYSAPSEPVLVELFTSQGCSSCPPADRLAERHMIQLDRLLNVFFETHEGVDVAALRRDFPGRPILRADPNAASLKFIEVPAGGAP